MCLFSSLEEFRHRSNIPYTFFNGVGKGGSSGGPSMLLLENVPVDGFSSLAALGLTGLVDGGKKLLPQMCCF